MDERFRHFSDLLEQENKKLAVEYALSLLDRRETDVVALYTDILGPALVMTSCSLENKQLCIWKEHVRTAIVRTIVECCYPYVIAERERRGEPARGTATVLCPPEEYHDLGARMVADFFTILGYETVFVGSNTPFNDFLNAADLIRPDVIAISVSNYYNLVVTKKIIDRLRSRISRPFQIVVGGSALAGNPSHAGLLTADHIAQSFADIEKIAKGRDIK